MAIGMQAKAVEAGAQKLAKAAQELAQAYKGLQKVKERILSGNTDEAKEYRKLKGNQIKAFEDVKKTESKAKRDVLQATVISLGGMAGSIENRLLKESAEYGRALENIAGAQEAFAKAMNSSRQALVKAVDGLDLAQKQKNILKKELSEAVVTFRNEAGRIIGARGNALVEKSGLFEENTFRLLKAGEEIGIGVTFKIGKEGLRITEITAVDELGGVLDRIYPQTRLAFSRK